MPAQSAAWLSVSAVLVLLPLGLSRPPLSAQGPSNPADRFTARLLQNRYPLAVRDGQLTGAGAHVLQSAIAQSRFVLLGEEHGNAQTPAFWAAVCNAAGPERFHTLAVEEGPLVAAELERFAGHPNGVEQLAAFTKTYPESLNVSSAREEFDMLQRCARAGQGEFRVWGLNQEMFGTAGLILSRVLASGIGGQARSAIQQLLQKNDEASRKAVQSGNVFELFMFTADDNELARAAALLQKDGSPEARSLFASLIESHEINRTPPSDYGNARRRERLMKTLFAANYARASRNAAAPPKVLLKFGAFHGYRGLNPVRGSGIGNYIAELAAGQGTQSLHIRLMPAKSLPPIFNHLLQSDWTMFDLRPFRPHLSVDANPDVASLVFGYDLLVIVPESTRASPIR
jgi:hypothetical protein